MKFLVSTGNPKKLKEINRILNEIDIDCVCLKDIGLDIDPEENADTFEGNAHIKAKAAFEASGGMPTIADDSGLIVDCLDGAPGVYTARYGGEGLSDKERYMLLLENMKGVPKEKRTARFVSAICCILPSGEEIYAIGKCEGEIGEKPFGDGGFGYDPVFYVDGVSFSQMTPSQKDEISHRGRALKILAEKLKGIKLC